MKWLSRLLGRGKPQVPGFVTVAVSEEENVRQAKIPKDVCVTLVPRGEQGDVSAKRRRCSADMLNVERDQLLWFICPQCGGTTFSPVLNLRGAMGYASRHGGTFEDLYYLNEEARRLMTPPDLKSA